MRERRTPPADVCMRIARRQPVLAEGRLCTESWVRRLAEDKQAACRTLAAREEREQLETIGKPVLPPSRDLSPQPPRLGAAGEPGFGTVLSSSRQPGDRRPHLGCEPALSGLAACRGRRRYEAGLRTGVGQRYQGCRTLCTLARAPARRRRQKSLSAGPESHEDPHRRR